MSFPFPFVAQRMFNTPLAVHEKKAEIVVAALAGRLGIAAFSDGRHLIPLGAREPAHAGDWYDPQGAAVGETPFDAVAGVAVIPVRGSLVQRTGTMRPYSGMTGYDGLRAAFNFAWADDQVKGIAVDIDTPGGEVAECFDLVDDIYRMRGTKPTWAILAENAFSAGYAIASACDRIIVPRTGGTGSVGVICLHADFSGALEKEGIVVTLITSGARKADGSQFQPLSDPARERFQADIDAMADIFVETVARNRSMSVKAVRDTEADTFLGAKGVDIGFADAVMAPAQAFEELLSQL